MSVRRTVPIIIALAIVVALLPQQPLSQQTASTAPSGDWCGSSVTPEEARSYLEGLAGPSGPVVPGPELQGPPYCVAIAGHIVRKSDGTGGMSISQYNQSIADANFYFSGTGIVFYSLGIDYIDSDFYYYNISTIDDINALRSENVVPAAINIYYTPTLPGLCGISSFTFSSVQGIVMNNACSGVPSNPSTMPHEIGHYFDLFHTHETVYGIEYVDGTNCATAGDRLCDTPADPGLGYHNVNASCVYFGGDTDPNGDPYAPDERQLMSYSRALCQDVFSPM